MDKQSKLQLKIRIGEMIHSLQEDIEDLEELTKPISPENAIGRVSRMDAINNRSVNEAALVSSRTRLSNLEKALSKIDDDDFGICVKCQKPIADGRLMLMPESTRCINCA